MIGCIDMDAFFASVEQATNPFLKGKPVGVIGAIERTVIVTSSYEARRSGVKTGMSRYEALKICPDLILVVANNQKYTYISRAITNFLVKIFKKVEVYSIDEAFFDLCGYTEDNFSDIAYIVKSWIKEKFDITCSIGIGESKLVAKMASGVNKPDGFCYVKKEDSIDFLDQFNLSDIWGIGERMERRFKAKGVRSLKDIRKMGPYGMMQLFGKNGLSYYEMACGRDCSSFSEGENIKSIGHSMTLPYDIYNFDKLKPYILQLSEMVSARARNNNISGKTVSVYIKFKNMEGEGAMVTLPYYTSATHHIYDTVCEIIKKRFKVEYGVRLLGVSLSKLMYNSSTLINIFDDPKLEKVYMLIDKINNRYGNWTIFQGGILECKRIGSKTISPAWRPEGVRNVEYSNL